MTGNSPRRCRQHERCGTSAILQILCLAALTVGLSDQFPVVLTPNRDEFFARAGRPLTWWRPSEGASPILSGKDLTGGATWLGLNAAGRLAPVTNVREPGRYLESSPSRGDVVLQCLTDRHADLAALARTPRNGFNLLAVDLAADPWKEPGTPVGQWISNRPAAQGLAKGTGAFGLSNAALDTPWPKVLNLKQRLTRAVDRHHELEALMGELFAAQLDRWPALDEKLPHTGVTTLRERQLSSQRLHPRYRRRQRGLWHPLLNRCCRRSGGGPSHRPRGRAHAR